MGVFVIAEAGSSHDNDLAKAYRLIEAAKECGADAVKFQWTSNAEAMALRRGTGSSGFAMYKHYLEKPIKWLHELKAHADSVGIEFMCSAFLIEDIQFVRHVVKRFKISAFESEWREFFDAHGPYGKEVIASHKYNTAMRCEGISNVRMLYCVSKYPTSLEDLHLGRLNEYRPNSGFSDHTTSTLTGALAVAAGATIVEKHIRLIDTDKGNPDYGHSLIATPHTEHRYFPEEYDFSTYVSNIREAEKAL